MRYNRLIVSAFILGLLALGAQARTVFVPGDFTNLQEAVDSLDTGDTIYVTSTYLAGYGNRDITTDGKGIVFQGPFGPGGVTINCFGSEGDAHRAFVFDDGEDSLTVIDGFRIIGGYADSGGAVYINRTTPIIRNCVFEGNIATYGGAIGGYQGAPRIYDCTFLTNQAQRGGAIDGLGPTIIRDSRFTGNHASQRGGAIADLHSAVVSDCVFDLNTGGGATFDLVGGSTRLDRCLFAKNASGGLSVVYGYQSMRIDRCTFVDNAYGIQALGDTYVVPTNTQIVFNRGDAAFCSITDSVTIYLNYCNVYGNQNDYTGCIEDNLGVSGNIRENPLFCDTSEFDFTLNSTSPCATAGSGGVAIGAFDVGCTPTDVDEDIPALPGKFALDQNYPNPFNPTTTISFAVPQRSDVSIAVYNILGEQVAVLLDQTVPAGSYDVDWDGTDSRGNPAASGVYFYRLQTSERTESKKMLLLK